MYGKINKPTGNYGKTKILDNIIIQYDMKNRINIRFKYKILPIQ